MIDPVTASDGHNYEKEALDMWFEEHDTLPLTNELSAKDVNGKPVMFRNKDLREAIATYKLETNVDKRMHSDLLAHLREGTIPLQ